MPLKDIDLLRRTFTLARLAREKGNGAFGALLTDSEGNVLLEAENTVGTDNDVVGHAETNLLRKAYQQFDAQTLAKCTLYSSTEPCPMCAGAVYWSGVGKVVFGLSIERLCAILEDAPDQMRVTSATILSSGMRSVTVIGPLLEDEAAQVFEEQY